MDITTLIFFLNGPTHNEDFYIFPSQASSLLYVKKKPFSKESEVIEM